MEYHVRFWGSAEPHIAAIGISGTDHWFSSKPDRYDFIQKIRACAEMNGSTVMVTESEGPRCRLRSVARMMIRLPDGRGFPYEMDFGYGYPPDSAHYMFHDGNYGCDCNLSRFAYDAGAHDLDEMECGDSIKLEGFRVDEDP